MPKTVKIAQTGDLSPGEGKVVEAEGQTIALFNVDGTYYAIENTCTHVGGPLGKGTLVGDQVTCPWHGATFDLTNGSVLSPPAPDGVASYKVVIEENEIKIEIP